jgi:hypothetical protein
MYIYGWDLRIDQRDLLNSQTLWIAKMAQSIPVVLRRRMPWIYILYLTALIGILYLGLNRGDISSKMKSMFDSTHNSMTASPVAQAPEAQAPAEEYLAFCVAAKDQSLDLPEFLQHHYYHMNVSRFYIMDDRSEPPLSSFDDYGIPRSALTFNYYTKKDATKVGPGFFQWWLYQECINLYRHQHTWMAFFDADEFLEVRTNETVEDILRGLESDDHIGALGINWITHTSAGILTRPESVRASFDVCFRSDFTVNEFSEIDRHVKSIVRTDKFNGMFSPHMFQLKDEAISVGEDGLEIKPGTAWRFPITRNRLALHHYATKSREEFQQKIDRWKGDIPKDWSHWDMLENAPHMDCPEMARYSP